MRQLEDAVGERRPRAVDRLDGAADRVAILVGVVVGETAARLHRVGGDPVDHRLVADDMGGPGERRVDRRPVADLVKKRLVAGVLVPYRRRVRRERGFGVDDGRQRLEIDVDQLGGIPRLVHALGDDERDRVSDIAHALARQQRLRADKGRRSVAPPAADRGQQGAEAAPGEILAGQHAEHTGSRHRPRRHRVPRCAHARAASAGHSHALRLAP